MAAPVLVENAQGQLRTYAGSVRALLSVGGYTPTAAVAFVSDIVAYEVDTADAPGYARQSFTAAYTRVGDDGVFDFASGQSATFDADGATDLIGWWIYKFVTSDADSPLICFVPLASGGAGTASFPLLAPEGFARDRLKTVDAAGGTTFTPIAPLALGGTGGDELALLIDGVTLTVVDGVLTVVGGGLGTVPAPVRLGADWCLHADTSVGANVWADQGRAGLDALCGGDALAVVDADAWTGLRIVGAFESEVGVTWPTDLDVTVSGRLLYGHFDPANQWIETLLVTIDGVEDYLEPAFVMDNDGVGVRFGLNVRFDGESSERSWLSADLLDDPYGDHVYRLTTDGDDLRFYVDGVLTETVAITTLPQQTPGTTVSAPYAMEAPPNGQLLLAGLKRTCLTEVVLLDGLAGAPLHRIDAADGTDGAVTITTDGEVWTQSIGQCMTAPTDKRIIGKALATVDDSALVDIGATDSFTWAIHGRPYGDAMLLVAGGLGYLTVDDPGWLFGSFSAVPSVPTWGFSIGAGPEYAVDAGAIPTADTVYVAVLDRAADELRLYANGVLVDTADVSALGAVAAGLSVLALGPCSLRWAAMWRRALDTDEIAWLIEEMN